MFGKDATMIGHKDDARGCSIPAADIINLDSALDTPELTFSLIVSRQLVSGQVAKTITDKDQEEKKRKKIV